MLRPRLSPIFKLLVAATLPAIAITLMVPPSARAEAGLSEPICQILKRMLPEMKSYQPENARAQFVIEISEKVDYDTKNFALFKAEADKAATANCPKEREDMLSVLKLKALSETFN